MKKVDKINFSLMRLSLLISLIAIAISIYFGVITNGFTQKQIELQEESMQSKVVAKIERDYSQNKVLFKQINLYDSKVIYKQKYILVLNNLGLVNTSITDLYLTLESKMYNSDKIGYGLFRGMGPWYYDIKGDKIDLPISIESNKPKKIILEVGVKVPIKAWSKLPDSMRFNQNYDYEKIEKLFSESGHPFMGQLDFIDNNTYGDKGNLQKYHLYITKGDDKRIKVWFRHNVSDHLQGETD